MKKGTVIYMIVIFFTIISSFFVLDKYHNPSEENFYLEDGSIDLSSWDGTPMDLEGHWVFYPYTYYEDIDHAQTALLRSVPDEWQDHEDMDYSPYGYGVYKGIVTGLEPNKAYGFRLLDQVTAYNLYVNDILSAQNGSVDDQIPEWRPVTGAFSTDASGVAEIVLEVSNAHYYRGGYWNSIQIGHMDKIMSEKFREISFEIFLIASILVMGIFFLGLYATHDHKPAALYFALFCFVVSAYSALISERVIQYAIQGVSWNTLIRAEYLLGYLILPVFCLFIMSLLSKQHLLVVRKLMQVFALIIVFMCVFAPHELYISMLEPYKYFGMAGTVLVLYLFQRALRSGHPGSNYMLTASASTVIAMIKENYYGDTFSFIPVAAFIIVVSFSLIAIDEFVMIERRNKKLETDSVLDKLTGLYNRKYIIMALREYVGKVEKEDAYLLFLDLDGFKFINDSYGHHIGDGVLKTISERLMLVVGSSDVIARFGGDEFLLFAFGKELDEVIGLSERIIDVLNEEITYEDTVCQVGVSIGICKYKDNWPVETWIENSDTAMYKSKRTGRNVYTVYDDARAQVKIVAIN